MSGYLNGLHVLDLSRLLPGPLAGQMLAEMGADVLKLEDPAFCDYARTLPPMVGSEGGLYALLNRGKRSIAINLREPEGVRLVKRLVKKYDVVIDSFRPGVLDKLGIGYEALRAENPEVIVCAITGYGQRGPFAGKAGHDLNYQALAGALALNGSGDGKPAMPGMQAADVAGGSQAAVIAIMGAVFRRMHTGEGELLDVSMTDALVGLQTIARAEVSAGGDPPKRGKALLFGGVICYNIYETKDGRHMAFSALEPKFFNAFLKAAGREDLIGTHYSPATDDNRAFLELKALFASHTRSEWETMLAGVDACCEPILDADEVAGHEHMAARALFFDTTTRDGHPYTAVRTAPTPRGNPADLSPAPALGAHTAEVLSEAGLAGEEIARLAKAGIVTLQS